MICCLFFFAEAAVLPRQQSGRCLTHTSAQAQRTQLPASLTGRAIQAQQTRGALCHARCGEVIDNKLVSYAIALFQIK